MLLFRRRGHRVGAMLYQRLSTSRYGWITLFGAALVLVLLAGYRPGSRTPSTLLVPQGTSLVKVDVALPSDYHNRSVRDFYKPFRDAAFAPWTCLDPNAPPSSRCKRPISAHAITALEYLASGGAYRIRYTGKDFLYRPLQVFGQTYRVLRLEWLLRRLREMADEGLLTRTVDGRQEPVRFDAIFRAGDSAQITKDTLSKDSGYLLFSLRSSPLHLDVPIPDPVAYGSNGIYVWPDRTTLVPWENKVDKVVFRGSASFSFGIDNWHSNNRFRAAQLSDAYPDLLDLGMTSMRVKPMPPLTGKSAESFFPLPTNDDITAASGIRLAEPLSFYEQSRFKYVIDIDGGLGSSRRIPMMQTGCVPLFVDSNWFSTQDRLVVPWVHYVPIAEDLTDLVDKVRWLRDHDDHARAIVANAQAFVDAYLTEQAAKEQLAAMLERYSDLLAPDVKLDDSDVEVDFCKLNGARKKIEPGPMGCSRGWKVWSEPARAGL